MLTLSAQAQRDGYSFLAVMQLDLPYQRDYPVAIFKKLGDWDVQQKSLKRFESALPLLQFYANRLIAADLSAGYAVIPIIESNNSPKAISRTGALGVWQLMPETAKKYGLKADIYEDERYLISQSTSAAIKHLRYLTTMFRHPVHVLAAYNWGEQNVQRLMQQTPDMNQFFNSPKLPLETRDYILKVYNIWFALSKLDVSHPLNRYPNVSYFVVDMTSGIDFSKDAQVQGFLNPVQTLSRERLLPTPYFYEYFQYKSNDSGKQASALPVCKGIPINNYQMYVVEDGDSHARIIQRFKLVNPDHKKEVSQYKLRPGLVIKVPLADSTVNYMRDLCQ